MDTVLIITTMVMHILVIFPRIKKMEQETITISKGINSTVNSRKEKLKDSVNFIMLMVIDISVIINMI